MKTKTTITSICLAIIAISFSKKAQSFEIAPEIYKKSAQTWIQKHIYNEANGLMITKKDLKLIVKLCDLSYQRSFITLKAQEAALESLISTWQGWQNIAQKRLNPAKKTPYNIAAEKKDQTTFWQLHDEHSKIGTTYAHFVNNVVDGDYLTTINAAQAVDELRAQARAVIVQSLANIQSLLGKLFYTPKKNLIGDLLNYIPQFAMYSFIEANNLNDTLSEKSWKILETIQYVGVQTWEKIEEGRASYYLAYYKETYKLMEQL